MVNRFFKAVSSVFSAIRPLRVKQLLAVVFASFFLLGTTACNATGPEVSGTGGTYTDKVTQTTGLREFTDRQDGKSRPDLGSYYDNDARDTSTVDAKAEDLVERANKNTERRADSPEKLVENYRSGAPLNERVGNISKDVGDAVEGLKDDVSEGADKNIRQIKTAADRTGQNAQKAAQDAKRAVQETGRDVADTTKRTVNKID